MAVNVRLRNGLAPSGGVGGASEGDLRGSLSDMISSLSGVANVTGGQLLVHQAASPAMTVVIDAGVGYIPNTAYDYTDSDSIKFWEAVVSGVTASRTLVIGANSSGLTRIDLVCIKMDTGVVPDSTASNIATLIVVAGTPGAGIPATPSYYVKLSEVTVANGASSIVNANITDKRVQVQINRIFLPLTKRVSAVASSATPTPNADTDDVYEVTALAAGATFGIPTGTPVDGQTLIIRIKDNGSAQTLAFNAIYRGVGVSLPTTTVIAKTLYIGSIYNSAAVKWDVLGVGQEF